MDHLFASWKTRASLTEPTTERKMNAPKSSSSSSSFNKNDKNALQSIIMFNHRYQKRPIDEDFLIRQREAKGTELLDEIAPYTTDKSSLFESLESERRVFLKKKLKAKADDNETVTC